MAPEEFVIKPLQPPIIMEYPKQLPSGEPLVVKGTTKYPDAQTTVWFKRENDEAKSQTVRNDDKGNFTLVAEAKLEDGIYKVWAETVDIRGAQSAHSEKVTVSVERPVFLKIGSWAISLLAVIVPLAALAFVFLFMIWRGWNKFQSLRRHIRKETREASLAVTNSFNLLKENIQEAIRILEKINTKRELTKEEEKILKQFKRDIEDAEKFIKKEVDDVVKLVK